MIQRTGVLVNCTEEDACSISIEDFEDIEYPVSISPFSSMKYMFYPDDQESIIYPGLRPFSFASIAQLLLNKPLHTRTLNIPVIDIKLNPSSGEITRITKERSLNFNRTDLPVHFSALKLLHPDAWPDTAIERSVKLSAKTINSFRATRLSKENFLLINVNAYKKIHYELGVANAVSFSSGVVTNGIIPLRVFSLIHFLREVFKISKIVNPYTNSGTLQLADFVPIRRVHSCIRHPSNICVSRDADFEVFLYTYKLFAGFSDFQKTTRLLIGNNLEIVSCSPKIFIDRHKRFLDRTGLIYQFVYAMIPYPWLDTQYSEIYHYIDMFDIDRDLPFCEVMNLRDPICTTRFSPYLEYAIVRSMNLPYDVQCDFKSAIEGILSDMLIEHDNIPFHERFIVFLSRCLNTPLQYCLRNPI